MVRNTKKWKSLYIIKIGYVELGTVEKLCSFEFKKACNAMVII